MRADPNVLTARTVAIRRGSLIALMCGLAGCGGDGPAPSSGTGGGVVIGPITPTPTPPPGPTPTPTPSPPVVGATDLIIFAASQSQSFATEGRYVRTDGGVRVSYNAESKSYAITTPADTFPTPLTRADNVTPMAGQPWTNFAFRYGGYFLIRASGAFSNPDVRYLYSNLAAWGQAEDKAPGFFGHTAFGMPTLGGALPQQGSVTYTGFIEGSASERFSYPGWGEYFGGIKGVVSLTFDFATGAATISVMPILELADEHPLPAITAMQLIWPRGATGFHLPDPGNAQSLNYPLSGRFTGPAGEELIGGLRLDYVSPIDGRPQTATAAFIAKRAD